MRTLVLVLVCTVGCGPPGGRLRAAPAGTGAVTATEPASSIRSAAERGDPEAQYRLGLAYRDGRGVPRDAILAHVWLHLASVHGHEAATAARDRLARTLTLPQLEEARRIAEQWALLFFYHSLE